MIFDSIYNQGSRAIKKKKKSSVFEFVLAISSQEWPISKFIYTTWIPCQAQKSNEQWTTSSGGYLFTLKQLFKESVWQSHRKGKCQHA